MASRPKSVEGAGLRHHPRAYSCADDAKCRHAQLHEERRLHELTSSKLAAAAEAAAELEHQSSRVDGVAELAEHCRRLDNRLQVR
jgi:hypothetical protein